MSAPRRSRRLARAAIALAAAGLAACGGSSGDVAGVADADLEFVQHMIPHHEQAVEMAALALDGRAGATLAAIAAEIRDAQGPEIDAMRAILAGWGEEEDEHAAHMGMPGMVAEDDLDALAALTGADFDRRWAELMIAHHEGAIEMAREVLADGADARVRALAEEIVAVQEREIEVLRGIA
jgi:uncharacterized protein (DUF305 family)